MTCSAASLLGGVTPIIPITLAGISDPREANWVRAPAVRRVGLAGRRLKRRAGGEPVLFGLGQSIGVLGSRLRDRGGFGRIACEQLAVGQRGVELLDLAREADHLGLCAFDLLTQRLRVGAGPAVLATVGIARRLGAA